MRNFTCTWRTRFICYISMSHTPETNIVSVHTELHFAPRWSTESRGAPIQCVYPRYILFCCIIFKRHSLILLCTMFSVYPPPLIQCVYTYHILWWVLTVGRSRDRPCVHVSLCFGISCTVTACTRLSIYGFYWCKKNDKNKQKKSEGKSFFFFDKKEIYGLINISKNKNLFFWTSLDRSDKQTGRFRSTAGGCLEMDRYIDMQTRRMDISISLLLARPWWISGGTSCFFSSRAESTFIPLDLCLPPSMYIPLSFFFAIYWSIVGQLQQWSHFHGESSCFINALFFCRSFLWNGGSEFSSLSP